MVGVKVLWLVLGCCGWCEGVVVGVRVLWLVLGCCGWCEGVRV